MSENQRIIRKIFAEYQEEIEEEQVIREEIREICRENGQLLRTATGLLQVIHYDESEVMTACIKAKELFDSSRDGYARLTEVVPPTDYYKYQEQWRGMLQRFCFLIALVEWLESGTLVSIDTVADVLGISSSETTTSFHLDTEDYLNGLLQLCSELARLAVNAATRGDYEKPVQISKFVMQLNSGFRLLTLKNDNLRKRFDVLKYDMKKIEEVVYDINFRRLG